LQDSLRTILHVDLDAFYASAEQSINPALRNKPLIVGADPKEGKGRGVVLTASYEARKYGIRSGLPISQAYRLCPDAIYVRPNWHLYGNLSNKVMDIMKAFATRLEQVSIDEAFLDVTDKVQNYDDARKLGVALKTSVKHGTGLTCSIGIAPNKSVAKIASDMQKPDGLTVVIPDKVTTFLAPLDISKISGIGPKSQKILHELNVKTIGELAVYPADKLVQHFGRNGLWMRNIANGLDNSEVIEQYERKSISAEHTFEEDVSHSAIVYKTLELLSSEVINALTHEQLLFRTIGIKIRFEGFETKTSVKTLRTYTDSQKVLIECWRKLFDSLYEKNRKIRLVGVRVSNLHKFQPEQKNLLTWVK